jgi:hypothetical protein
MMVNGSYKEAPTKCGVIVYTPTLYSCLAMDWTTRRSRFNPWQRQEIFSSNLCVQTSSGAHPASRAMGPFPGVKSGRVMTLTTHPHLVARLKMSRSYTSPPSAFMSCSLLDVDRHFNTCVHVSLRVCSMC